MKLRIITCLIFSLLVSFMPSVTQAHGVKVEYNSNLEVEVVATYDTSEPMSGAQVTVYTPNDPSRPWLTGECDEEGRFTFTPDISIPGIWDVQVRQAGHGDMIHIEIDEGMVTSGSSGGYSTGQIALMAFSVIWGITGTALYIKGRKA